MALTQQSSAVLALVSHLASQGDPLSDIPGVSAHSTSIKGVQKREKMQQDLAAGTSTYYLQVMQQLHKKLFPSLPLPKSVDELGHLSVLTYLERTGGYKHARDAGLLMWLLGYAVDALMMVALDQSVVDGDWVSCLSSIPGRGSPTGHVFGQDKRGISLWKALFKSGTSSMVIGGSCLCERDGSTAKQKAGNLSQTTEECRPRESIAKKKAKISEEASLRSGAPKSPMRMKREEISGMDGQIPDDAVPSAVMHDDVVNTRNDLFDKKISFASWCAQMVASVFRTRTPFSAFVRSAIHLTRDPQVSTSPAFPIPLPHFGVFDRMPSGLSLRQRSRYHFRRAVVLTILALNFWWSGNRFVDLNLLRRSPSVSQRRIIRRVVDFMQVDGPKIPFEVSLAGRRSPQLVARLCELSDALTSAGVRGSPYDHTFEGRSDAVPTDNTAMPELEPYRSLDFERLLVVGEGHFDPVPFLDDNLCMAYCNPDCLLHPGLPGDDDVPVCRDPLKQVVGLMRIWDLRGLLVLHECDVPGLYPHESIRIFNCYKNRSCDRQIGDRRGRNFCEMRLFGPSKLLPAGPDVFELFLEDGEEVHVSISDRRDFYHQFRTTYTRAISNTLSPGLPVDLIEDILKLSLPSCFAKQVLRCHGMLLVMVFSPLIDSPKPLEESLKLSSVLLLASCKATMVE